MTWKNIVKADNELTNEYVDDYRQAQRDKRDSDEPVSSYRGMDEYVMPIAEKMYDLILKELDKVVGSIGEENKYSKEEGIEDLRATILAIMYGNNKRF
tara:strand:- start:1522 stop:1815 length:294 start_codon:yes stop_codon:yes gene_type:complete